MLWKLNNKSLSITHPEKVLFTKPTILKEEIVKYYRDIAPFLVPLIKQHPMTLLRYPEGIAHEGFFQKDIPAYFPSWIARCPVIHADGHVVKYALIQNAASLVYVANQGCLTPHMWLSCKDKLKYPDRMIFDIDPPGEKFNRHILLTLVKDMGTLLQEIGLESFVMTTGSRGFHVVVPLIRRYSFDFVHEYARIVSQAFVERQERYATIMMSKTKREGKFFIDYLRNGFSATAVAPYAVRARPGAPVAMPIDWDELSDERLSAVRYTYRTVFERLEKKGDPWKSFYKKKQSLKYSF